MAALTPTQREALEMLVGVREPGKVLPATLQSLLDDGWCRVGLYGEFVPTEAGVLAAYEGCDAMTDAPLGPATHHIEWYRHAPDVYNHGGWDIAGEYWLDQMGHEYVSIEHLLSCALARALGVER